MLQTSPEWKNSKLILKTIVAREADRERALEQAEKFLEEGRLAAEIKVLVENSQADLIGITIKHFSKDYDLVFLGMRPPGQDETAQEYTAYYEQLMKQTEKYPPAALVLAGEDIKFSEIFQ